MDIDTFFSDMDDITLRKRKILNDILLKQDILLKHSYMTTYCNGPILKINKTIKRKHFVKICNQLTEEFGKIYIFSPDKISDGGIKIEPNKVFYKQFSKFEYKSMRFQSDTWPWIDNVNEWYRDESLLFEEGTKIYTFLRSTRAPEWKFEELVKFQKVFSKFNIRFESFIEIKRKKRRNIY